MRLKRTFSAILVLSILGLAGAGLAACGGGSDDETATNGSGGAGAAPSENGAATEESAATQDGGGATEAGGDTTAPSGDAVLAAKVEIDDFAYEPDPVTIEEGGKVIWVNRDAAPHTATAEDGSFDTGTLEEGKLGSESFKQPGAYAYVCSIHPQMHGTVEVVAAG